VTFLRVLTKAALDIVVDDEFEFNGWPGYRGGTCSETPSSGSWSAREY
jgi:hypothetical protein